MEGSWRKQFQMDDEEEALARALELSRLDYQQSQRASANPPDQRGQPSSLMRLSPLNLKTTGREGRDYVRNQVENVQSTWDMFIQTKCSEVKAAAVQLYERTMMSQLDGALPCDSDEIRRVHEMAMEESMKEFETSTVQISAESCKSYLEELMEHMEKDLRRWHEENKRRTKEGCQDLLNNLKRKHLDSILQRLTGPMGASVSFDQIENSLLAIESDFQKLSRGAKDVCAQEFFKFQPEMQSEMEKYKAHLKQLKDYDEKLSQERKDRAIKEKEMQRILEENARFLEKTHTKQKEMELLMQEEIARSNYPSSLGERK